MCSHILVINRFDNDLGDYTRYLDHTRHAVAYLTTKAGAAVLDPASAETIVVVDDLADTEAVLIHGKSLVARYGPFDHLIVLSEFDLELGAVVREALNIPGPGIEDIRRVRDKVTMKTLVGAAGLRAPAFTLAESPSAVREFAAEWGFPLVLKPRRGWDSQGVFLVRAQSALDDLLAGERMDDYECEQFIEGQMYHVDGVADDGEVRLLRSSKLLATCLDFALGKPFGSVANDDADLERRLRGYAQRVVRALGIRTSAFHLEVFRTADDSGPDGAGDLVFLEIGGRIGGAQIPWIWREVYGVDLIDTWVKLLVGERPELPEAGIGSVDIGGYLLMPEPPQRPCRVLGVRPLLGRVRWMYKELLPEPGVVLDGTGGAKETAGHYRFRGPDSASVEQAIRQVIAEYSIAWEPVEPDHDLDGKFGGARAHGRLQAVVR